MDPEETTCLDCGAPIDLEGAGVYVIIDEDALCAECASRRGGVYDSGDDRWTIEPTVADLPDERRPHP